MPRPARGPSVAGMTSATSFRVVVAGGGVAGIEALLTLRALAGDHVDLTLVDARPTFVHRPLLVAEPFGRERAGRMPLDEIARDAGARLVADVVASVDDGERVAVTHGGERLRYDALLLATGATSVPAYRHALNWDERTGNERLSGLLADIEQGYVRRLALIVPPGPGWPLPAYELALLTAHQAWGEQMRPKITLVTPEPAPLAVFGPRASAAMKDELARAGIGFHGGAHAAVEHGHTTTVVVHPGNRRFDVDRVVALPRLLGRAPAGVPADAAGFVAVDAHGKVRGLRHVWAAGDGVAFPVKFGGLAADQADAAAEAIAAEAGADVTPWPFRPVLRGRLLMPRGDRFMHHTAGGGAGDGVVSDRALWWPPGKVAGRRLGPYLAAREGHGSDGGPAGLALQVDLSDELARAAN
jgi:sulfide:quinone oxidoreductase